MTRLTAAAAGIRNWWFAVCRIGSDLGARHCHTSLTNCSTCISCCHFFAHVCSAPIDKVPNGGMKNLRHHSSPKSIDLLQELQTYIQQPKDTRL